MMVVLIKHDHSTYNYSLDSSTSKIIFGPMGITQITQGELAKAMGVGRKTVNELCGSRRGVTAETAFLLSKVLGTTPEFWLNLQIMNDLWIAKHSEVLVKKLERARPFAA